MKKVIKGLLYDTDTATMVYFEENTKRRLYRTPKGNFFIMYPNGIITPKTEEETKSYLGEKDVDAYIEIFGEPEEA